MIECLECGEIFETKTFALLSGHLKRIHKLKFKNYIIKHYYSGIHPVCICGCENKVAMRGGKFNIFLKNHWWKSDEIKNKVKNSLKETCLQKYGVENVMQLDWVKHKIENTNNERYGTKCPLQSSTIKEKTKKTIKERYNIDANCITDISQNLIFKKRIFDKQKHKFAEILKICEKKQYFPLFDIDEYSDHRQYLSFKCLIHDVVFKTQLFSIKQKANQCPKCKIHGFSLKEKEVCNFIKTFYLDIVLENVRNIIPKKYELDIFLPKSKIAIEFNGEYWHGNDRARARDNEKYKLCVDRNIKLITVHEKDWDLNQGEVKEKLKKDILEKINVGQCVSTD